MEAMTVEMEEMERVGMDGRGDGSLVNGEGPEGSQFQGSGFGGGGNGGSKHGDGLPGVILIETN